MRRAITIGLLAVVIGVVCAPQASAKTYVNPWAGVIFGNDEAATGFRSFGASLGDAGGSLWGTETNIGISPGFFGSSVENYVLDFMAGITVGPTYGGRIGRSVRPYGVGEVGMIRSSIDAGAAIAKFARNDFGVCVGGGLTIELNDRLGLRGDVRYFRAVGGDDALNNLKVHLANFSYWRAAIGITLQ